MAKLQGAVQPKSSGWQRLWRRVDFVWGWIGRVDVAARVAGGAILFVAGLLEGFFRQVPIVWVIVMAIGAAAIVSGIVSLIREGRTAPAGPLSAQTLLEETKQAIQKEVGAVLRSVDISQDQHYGVAISIELACSEPGTYEFNYGRSTDPSGLRCLQLSKDIPTSVVRARDDQVLDQVQNAHKRLLARISQWSVWHTLNPGPVQG